MKRLIFAVYTILITLGFIVLWFTFDCNHRLIRRISGGGGEVVEDLSLSSWKTSLKYLNYDADIVFIGDSITRWHDFQKDFPEKRVVNLGISGDTLMEISNRIEMVKFVTPEYVFVMGGINNLKDDNINECIDVYLDIIYNLKFFLPDSLICIESILPVSHEKEKMYVSNKTIEFFNMKLKDVCEDNNVVFVDLYSLYTKNGEMNSIYSEDGVHIRESGYDIWVNTIKGKIIRD